MLSRLIRGTAAAGLALLALSPARLTAQRGREAPTNVTIAASGTMATVSWTPVRGREVRYRVLRALDAGTVGVDLTPPTTMTSLADSKAVAGTTYFYQVVALYPDGSTGASAPVAFALPALLAPTSPRMAGRLAGLSGQVLPLLPSSLGTSRSAIFAALNSSQRCDPPQPSPGPSPSSFFLEFNLPGGPIIDWPEVVGSAAYVVERAVDGTNNWSIAGTTCGMPNGMQRLASGHDSYAIVFADVSGGIIPNTQYVYRVKAYGASGEMGWNSTRWTAPVAPAATWLPEVITGSTAKLRFVFPSGPVYWADEWILTASDGRKWTGVFPMAGIEQSQEVLGLAPGTYTFTLTSQWVQTRDPRMPRVTASSTTQTTITIKI